MSLTFFHVSIVLAINYSIFLEGAKEPSHGDGYFGKCLVEKKNINFLLRNHN